MSEKKKVKVRRLTSSDTLEVGDLIMKKDFLGERTFKVHRVTPKYAFIRWNDIAEGSFRRDKVRDDGDIRLRGADIYSQVRYTAYRKVEA